MPIWLYRADDGLQPLDDEARAGIRKLKAGQKVLAHIDRVRSPDWHRLYYARCKAIGENQEPQLSANAVDLKTRMIAGHKDFVGQWNGEDMFVPARIAFDKLSREGWERIWQSLEAAHELQLPGICNEIAGHS